MHCNEKDPAGHNQDPVCRNEDLQPNKRIKKKKSTGGFITVFSPLLWVTFWLGKTDSVNPY